MSLDNVIVIPYRDRSQHLRYFIENTLPLITQYMPNSKVVVVEQTHEKLFNRGLLLNIGFKEYQNKTKYFFTHDVDLNPTKKCINGLYNQQVDDQHVLGIYTSHCNTLGGIIKITNNTIHMINGFPNNIWGWGSEDKALQNRAEYFNIKKITNLTNDKEHPEYILRFNDIDDRNRKFSHVNHNHHYNQFQRLNNEEKLHEIMNSGINNLIYTTVDKYDISDNMKVIKVSI